MARLKRALASSELKRIIPMAGAGVPGWAILAAGIIFAGLHVLYGNAGLTSTLGHPFIAYEPRAMGIGWPACPVRWKMARRSRPATYSNAM